MDSLDLRRHAQVVELYPGEALALSHALRLYLGNLVLRSSYRLIYRQELLSLKPLGQVLSRLSRMQLQPWPRDKHRRLKPRKWKLEPEQLVMLNRLILDDQLFAAQFDHQNDFISLHGRLNQKALNLTQYFEL